MTPSVLSVLTCVLLFVTPWTVARQASVSMEFSRQEYWSGLPLPTPVDLSNPGIEPVSLGSQWQVDSLPVAPPGAFEELMLLNCVVEDLRVPWTARRSASPS